MFSHEESLLQKLANPVGLQGSFLNYLTQAGVIRRDEWDRLKREKTFQENRLFHKQITSAVTAATFFSGAVNAAGTSTNMSSFITNKDEHKIIYGIKAYTAINATLLASAWAEGLSGVADVANGTFELSVNGVNQISTTSLQVFVEADEDAEAGIYIPIKPIIWPGQQAIKLTTAFPVALTTNTNIMFELITMGLNS